VRISYGRMLHWLKWLPLLAPLLTIRAARAAVWWSTFDIYLPFPASWRESELMRRLDIFFVFLLYLAALVYRLNPKTGRLKGVTLRWHILAWGFFAVGLLSMRLNAAPTQSALSVILSLGRNSVFWAALTMLPWKAHHLRQTVAVLRWFVALNLLAVIGQSFLFVSAMGIGLPGDWAMGIFGLANDAALLNFTCAAGLFFATGSRLKRVLQAGGFLLAGLLSAFLTGTVVFVASLPIMWVLTRRGHIGRRILAFVGGVILVAIVSLIGLRLYSEVYADQLSAYTDVVLSRQPGFILGLEPIINGISKSPKTLFLGLGPGTVNSAPVTEGNLDSRLDGLQLGYLEQFNRGRRGLTYDWMDQSYLVALAETGLLGLVLLAAFWLMLLLAVVKVSKSWATTNSRLRVFSYSRISALLCLVGLGIVSVYWNESPFTYLTLLTLAPLMQVPSADAIRSIKAR